MRLLYVLFEIVFGLALVGTIATSTNSGSTALAGFTSAQALVILIPLIFVGLIVIGAIAYFRANTRKGLSLIFHRY